MSKSAFAALYVPALLILTVSYCKKADFSGACLMSLMLDPQSELIGMQGEYCKIFTGPQQTHSCAAHKGCSLAQLDHLILHLSMPCKVCARDQMTAFDAGSPVVARIMIRIGAARLHSQQGFGFGPRASMKVSLVGQQHCAAQRSSISPQSISIRGAKQNLLRLTRNSALQNIRMRCVQIQGVCSGGVSRNLLRK